MSAPNYQDIQPDSVPTVHIQNADVKVLAGAVEGVQGPVKTTAVAPTFLDVVLRRGPSEIAMSADESAFIYVYEGDVAINKGDEGVETILRQGELGVLSQKGTQLCVSTDTECKFIVVSGKPINEPVVQYGPFVMNSQQE